MAKSRRVYKQSYPHPVGVYRTNWGKGWFAQPWVPGMGSVYLGAVDSPEHGAAVVAEFRERMGLGRAPLPPAIDARRR